ncbi:5-(carboxyamino)imidazole ribonucleotide synthase [Thalassotalea fusca]
MNLLVLGAGQLARMMALAAKPLNIEIRAYDVGSNQVVDPLRPTVTFGALADGIAFADAITAEFEHISHDVLAICEQSGKLYPSSQAIKTGGDRRIEKQQLEASGAANAKHAIIASEQDYRDALDTLSLPLIFKSALEGYDGKGQWRLKSQADADDTWRDISSFLSAADPQKKQGIIAEQMVPFDREVSLVGVRDKLGNTKVYPLAENHHTNGVLSVSTALVNEDALQAQASDIFDRVASQLDYVGVLAIEFFQVGEQLLVNEIAPRVHNSGHWTQQGADTCQFENHVRTVCGLPIGSTALVRPTAMINILGEDTLPNSLLAIPGVAIHWYGKAKRAGRKMGHINVSAATSEQLQHSLTLVAKALPDNTTFADIKAYINKN